MLQEVPAAQAFLEFCSQKVTSPSRTDRADFLKISFCADELRGHSSTSMEEKTKPPARG